MEEALDSLRATLHSVQLPGHEISLAEALACRDTELEDAALQAISASLSEIEALMREDARFPTGELCMAHFYGWAGIFPRGGERKLVARALKTSGAEAVAWCAKLLGTTSARGRYIYALWGAHVQSRVQLDADLALVPFSDLPESERKAWALTRPRREGLAAMTGIAWMSPPTAALVASHVLEPLIFPPTAAPSHEAATRLIERVDDAALCLTAIGPRAASLAQAWWEFDDDDVRDADLMRVGSYGKMMEIVPRLGQTFPTLDGGLAVEVLAAFRRMQADAQARVRLALRRLGQALRRHELGDKAIELAIAFETLTADGDSNEVSHKVKVRATKLLGGDSAARTRNAKLVSETYAIRSKQMHTGAFDASKSRTVAGASLTPAEILEQTASLCADLIVAIIRRGSIPTWAAFDIDA